MGDGGDQRGEFDTSGPDDDGVLDRALALQEDGAWETGFDLLMRSGRQDDAVAYLERIALPLLASGDVMRLRAAVRKIAPSRRRLLLRVADAEAQVRSQRSRLYDLELLAADAEADAAAGGADYRPWVSAVIAEHFFFHGDSALPGYAFEALGRLPAEDTVPSLVLLARGRLRRLVGLGMVVAAAEDSQRDAGRGLLDDAVADFARGGWEEEQCMTGVLHNAIWTAMSFCDVDRTLLALREAAARLATLRSEYTPFAMVLAAHCSFLAGDLASVHHWLGEAEAHGSDAIPVLDAFAHFVRAVCDLLGRGPDSVALGRLVAIAGEFRGALAESLGSVSLTVAHILACYGALGAAREWADRAAYGRFFIPHGDRDWRELELRLRLLELGDPADVPELLAVLGEWRDLGFVRRAGLQAAMAARDCERVGLAAEARGLRDFAVSCMPPPEQRTLWEAYLSQPLFGAALPESPGAAPTRADAAVRLRLLRGDPEVERDGRVKAIPSGSGRLLATLVAQRRAATVDRVADVLWPEVDMDSGRNRLKQAMFRLRRVLGVESDELVASGAAGLELRLPGGWTLDVWDFLSLSEGGTEDRLAAFQMYRDHVCNRQLAYEDCVEDLRRRLKARWVDMVVGLLEDRSLDPRVALERVFALDVRDEHLAAVLRDRLEEAGQVAEAAELQRWAAAF